MKAVLRVQRSRQACKWFPFVLKRSHTTEPTHNSTRTEPRTQWTLQDYTKVNEGPAIRKYLADGYKAGEKLATWGDSTISLKFRTSFKLDKGVFSHT